MPVRRYVFTLRSTEALRSLIAFVAGITRISLSKVHTSDMQMRWAGDRSIMSKELVFQAKRLTLLAATQAVL